MPNLFFVHPDQKLINLYRSHAPYSISFDSANSGLEAIKRLRQFSPHIIVSAYNLPDVSGLSLLRHVRGHRHMHSIPFIFLATCPFCPEVMEHLPSEWLTTSAATPQILYEKIFQHLKLSNIRII